MSSPSPASLKEVTLAVRRQAFPFPVLRYLCKAWWICWKRRGAGTRERRCDVRLGTGHDFSVIPRNVQRSLRAVVTPEPGWRGDVPTWFGIDCDIGRVEMRLPVQASLGVPYWRFPLLVLLPVRPSRYDPSYIWLGSQFLEEYRVEVRLGPTAGKLLIP